MPKAIDVALARLELESPNLVVVRLKPGVKITIPRVIEIMYKRRAMVSGVAVGMYVIAPGELDWQADSLNKEFFGPELDRIKALAVMVDGPVFAGAVNLYFRLFAGRCPVKVVGTIEEGYAWLAKRGFAIAKAKRRGMS